MEISVRKTAIIILVALGAIFWAFEKSIALENTDYILTDTTGRPVLYTSSNKGFLIALPSFPIPVGE
jgi:hypothetical protein